MPSLAAIYMWNSRLVEDNTRLKRQFDRYLAELPKQMRKEEPKKKVVAQRPKGLIGREPSDRTRHQAGRKGGAFHGSDSRAR